MSTSKNGNFLEDILQGEISAVETYDQVLDKLEDDPRAIDLQAFRSDHQAAIAKLKQEARIRLEEVPKSSGAWGTWAKLATGTAKIFGDKSALKALKEGEEHGLKQYESALNEDIDIALKNLIRNELLPNQHSHIRTLDTLMEQAS